MDWLIVNKNYNLVVYINVKKDMNVNVVSFFYSSHRTRLPVHLFTILHEVIGFSESTHFIIMYLLNSPWHMEVYMQSHDEQCNNTWSTVVGDNTENVVWSHTSTHKLMTWCRNICDQSEPASKHEHHNMNMRTDNTQDDRASTVQCQSRKTTAGGSTPPTITDERDTCRHVTWTDENGVRLCTQHSYT